MANTRTAHGRLMLTVLGGLAEFDLELIRTRTGEGRARQDPRADPGSPLAHTAPAEEGDSAPR